MGEKICSSLSKFPTVQSWLSGANMLLNIDTTVCYFIIDTVNAQLKKDVRRNLEPIQDHMDFLREFARR